MIVICALLLIFIREPFIYDGDTIYMGKLGVRIYGINTPEMDTRYGPVARDALKEYIKNKDISCKEVTVDKYNRSVSVCVAGGKDIGAWMVQNGHAYAYFSNKYKPQEDYARQHHLGMFKNE